MSDDAGDDDPVELEVAGPTPAGGVRATVTFVDAGGQPVPRSQALHARIVEFDDEGAAIATTVGALEGSGDASG